MREAIGVAVYHEIIAAVEGRRTDAIDRIGNSDLFKRSAITESEFTDAFDPVVHNNGTERCAVIKALIGDLFDIRVEDDSLKWSPSLRKQKLPIVFILPPNYT